MFGILVTKSDFRRGEPKRSKPTASLNLVYIGGRHNRTVGVNRRFVLAVGLRKPLAEMYLNRRFITIGP